METAPPNMAPVCVPCTSVTNSQNVLPISIEPSLNHILLSDTFPAETTSSRLMKIRPVRKILRKYSTGKNSNFPFLTMKKLIIPRKRWKKRRGNKVKGPRN
jgi:hypothetical protein